MAELSFDTKEEADLYKKLRDKNRAGGFDTEAEANQYSSLKKKATANTHTSYWGDVVSNVGKAITEDLPKLFPTQEENLKYGGGAAPIKLGQMALGAVKGIGQVAGGALQTGAEALLKANKQGPLVSNDPEMQKMLDENKAAFKGFVDPYIHPIDTFREKPITTVLSWLPALKLTKFLLPETAMIGNINKAIQAEKGVAPGLLKNMKNVRTGGEQLAGKVQKSAITKMSNRSKSFDAELDAANLRNPNGINASPIASKLNDAIKADEMSSGALNPVEKVWSGDSQLGLGSGMEIGSSGGIAKIINDIPELKGMLLKPEAYKNTNIKLLQDVKNQISKGSKKGPLGLAKYDDLDAAHVKGVIDQVILEADPIMGAKWADYGQVMEEFGTLKPIFKEGRTIGAMKRGIGDAQIQRIVNRFLEPDLVREVGGYSKAWDLMNNKIRLFDMRLSHAPLIGEKLPLGKPSMKSTLEDIYFGKPGEK